MSLSSFDVDKKYTVLQSIGKGSAGSVFLCKSKRDHKSYALKQIFLDKRKKSRSKDVVLREVLILQKLDHPHVVHYHEAFFDRKQDNLFIIQDYCARGSLWEQVKTSRQKGTLIPERQIMEWFVQVTMALRYIHGKRVLHRDLKTQNVFLTKANMIKIGDFGIARVLEHTVDMASTCVGTPCYLSPEICQDKPYNSKSDIWALGCLLYELCALKPAFNASNLVSLCYKIVRGSYEHIPDQYSNLVKMLVEKSLQKSPEDRPTATTILNLPEVKAQLSVYISDKETERQSAHPQKREAALNNAAKARRKTARPSVINIGAVNSKVAKKGKKSPVTNSGNTKKKKKKKTSKAQNVEAEEVKKLPDEISQGNNRPVAPGRIKDPFKAPVDDLPPILKHNAVIGYSPPTIRREDPSSLQIITRKSEEQPVEQQPCATPAQTAASESKKVFMTEYTTQTTEMSRGAEINAPENSSRPADHVNHTTADHVTSRSHVTITNTDRVTSVDDLQAPSHPATPPISSKTYAKAPATPLFRIPKANKPSPTNQHPDKTELRKVPISLTSPMNTDVPLKRSEEEGSITPLPEVSQDVMVPIPGSPEPLPSLPAPTRQPPAPACSQISNITEGQQVCSPTLDDTTLGEAVESTETDGAVEFVSASKKEEAGKTFVLMPGQVEVGWSVCDGTQSFTPAHLENSTDQGSFGGVPHEENLKTLTEQNVTSHFTPDILNDNLDLNLDDVPSNQFPNEPVGDAGEEGEEEEEDEEFEYSDDFEEYEEIPDFENVEDIPDVTTPGEENEADSDEEEDDEAQLFEMAMKSAKVALDNIEEEDDEEFVEDFVMPTKAGNIAALRQYCLDVLGHPLFGEVQRICREFEDNYDSHDTFLKKLEKMAGPEKLEICLIVDEFFADEDY